MMKTFNPNLKEYTLKIHFKKLTPDAVTPTKAHPTDAGFDLTATGVEWVLDKKTGVGFWEYSTGIAVHIPPGYVGLIFQRSSVSKVNQGLCNAVGVIDSGYFGEILLRFKPVFEHQFLYSKTYKPGERIGQLVIFPLPTVELIEANELGESERGTGGFGSTGK